MSETRARALAPVPAKGGASPAWLWLWSSPNLTRHHRHCLAHFRLSPLQWTARKKEKKGHAGRCINEKQVITTMYSTHTHATGQKDCEKAQLKSETKKIAPLLNARNFSSLTTCINHLNNSFYNLYFLTLATLVRSL